MRSSKLTLILTLSLGIAPACKKKSDSKDDNSAETDKLEIAENLKDPKTVLDKASTSLASAMDTEISSEMVSSLALPALAGEGLSVDDCDDNAEPLARSGDDASYKDNSNRLRITHPRMPLQDFYCKMQKDTGSPDSFLGAVSEGRMLLCIVGGKFLYDSTKTDITFNVGEMRDCAGDISDEQKDEMFGTDLDEEKKGTVTGSIPPAFGDPTTWDASIEIAAEGTSLRILLRNREGILAIANNNGADRAVNIDGWVLSINQETGEARYEGKFQRIRTADGTGSNGWTRHQIGYVKGSLSDDFVFTEVESAQGAYSNISNSLGESAATSSDDPLTQGSIWTIAGSVKDGFVANSYELACAWEDDVSSCPDPNVAANWTATAGSGSCNGALTGTTCKGDGLPITKDAQTSFVMDLNNSDFVTSEDWFDSVPVPAFKDITISGSQE